MRTLAMSGRMRDTVTCSDEAMPARAITTLS
jgi:hypothetical protein